LKLQTKEESYEKKGEKFFGYDKTGQKWIREKAQKQVLSAPREDQTMILPDFMAADSTKACLLKIKTSGL